ncbi:MAG: DsrE family protein [Campylobacterota bacterium]|nr:DsrE family protein [Campylobacterota bacterium]
MRIVIALFISVLVLFGETDFSDPQPSFDNPRKMIVQISNPDLENINHILSSINNILKEYPTGTIEVAVVAYYHGLVALRQDADQRIKGRIQALMTYDVEFIACNNTMGSKGWKESDMIEDISYVQAGLAEVLERVVSGWINIHP